MCAIALMQHGDSKSQGRRTALTRAAERGRVECVRLLIDAGADKDATTNVRVGLCFGGVPSLVFLFFPAHAVSLHRCTFLLLF